MKRLLERPISSTKRLKPSDESALLPKVFIEKKLLNIASIEALADLVTDYPDYKEDLYRLALKPRYSNKFVTTSSCVIKLANCFSEHKEEIYGLFFLKIKNLKERNIKNALNRFTQAVTVGLFSHNANLDTNVSRYIASFLEERDIVNMLQTNKAAAQMGNDERKKIEIEGNIERDRKEKERDNPSRFDLVPLLR